MSEYRNGSWTHPSSLTDKISLDGQEAMNPQVEMSSNGEAIIVWDQFDGTTNCFGNPCTQIFFSQYKNGDWTHPSSLTDNISPDGQGAFQAQVALDDDGNATVVWMQSDGSNRQIFMSEYRNGTWTHPSSLTDNISPDGQDASAPQVAMDSNGNIVVVWSQSDGSNSQIFMSEYRNGTWTHPSSLTNNISPDGRNAYEPQVAMDNNDSIVIVWNQSDGSNWQIFMSEYRNGNWIHPSSLTDNISPDGPFAMSPQVAMSENGDAIITWQQLDASYDYQIFMSEFW